MQIRYQTFPLDNERTWRAGVGHRAIGGCAGLPDTAWQLDTTTEGCVLADSTQLGTSRGCRSPAVDTTQEVAFPIDHPERAIVGVECFADRLQDS